MSMWPFGPLIPCPFLVRVPNFRVIGTPGPKNGGNPQKGYGISPQVRDRYHLDPQCTSIKGRIDSIRWYLGCLKGYLGGAGICGANTLDTCRNRYLSPTEVSCETQSLNSGPETQPTTWTPQWTSIQGLMVSIRWYLGFLQGQLGGCWKNRALHPSSGTTVLEPNPVSNIAIASRQNDIGNYLGLFTTWAFVCLPKVFLQYSQQAYPKEAGRPNEAVPKGPW